MYTPDWKWPFLPSAYFQTVILQALRTPQLQTGCVQPSQKDMPRLNGTYYTWQCFHVILVTLKGLIWPEPKLVTCGQAT